LPGEIVAVIATAAPQWVIWGIYQQLTQFAHWQIPHFRQYSVISSSSLHSSTADICRR